MSRFIDVTKPLSPEDRKYLEDRCLWARLAQADEVAQEEARAAAEAGAVVTQVSHPVTHVAGPLATTPTDGPPAAPEDDDYTEWSYAELQAELKARKEDAVAQGMSEADAKAKYSAGGSQADLVARLEADDAEGAGEPA